MCESLLLVKLSKGFVSKVHYFGLPSEESNSGLGQGKNKSSLGHLVLYRKGTLKTNEGMSTRHRRSLRKCGLQSNINLL